MVLVLLVLLVKGFKDVDEAVALLGLEWDVLLIVDVVSCCVVLCCVVVFVSCCVVCVVLFVSNLHLV